jgi:hypothetical protein
MGSHNRERRLDQDPRPAPLATIWFESRWGHPGGRRSSVTCMFDAIGKHGFALGRHARVSIGVTLR